MPDLQTELSKVITSWETPDTAPAQPSQRPFQVSTNTSRATFDYVRDNPGMTRVQAVRALTAQGHKKTSVSSLLVQMVRQGMLRDSSGALFVTQSEYSPVKPRLVKAAQAALPARRRRKLKAVEAPKPQAPVAAPKVDAPAEFDAEELVNSLTLKQAKAVYEELRKVFG